MYKKTTAIGNRQVAKIIRIPHTHLIFGLKSILLNNNLFGNVLITYTVKARCEYLNINTLVYLNLFLNYKKFYFYGL